MVGVTGEEEAKGKSELLGRSLQGEGTASQRSRRCRSRPQLFRLGEGRTLDMRLHSRAWEVDG